MNRSLASALLLALAAVAASAAPPVRKPLPAPAAPASAASAPIPIPRTVTPSPAVRASEETQLPGDVRPENRVVPQIVVPLRRAARDERPASAVTDGGRIDDGAARRAAGKR